MRRLYAYTIRNSYQIKCDHYYLILTNEAADDLVAELAEDLLDYGDDFYEALDRYIMDSDKYDIYRMTTDDVWSLWMQFEPGDTIVVTYMEDIDLDALRAKFEEFAHA